MIFFVILPYCVPVIVRDGLLDLTLTLLLASC